MSKNVIAMKCSWSSLEFRVAIPYCLRGSFFADLSVSLLREIVYGV